jgi:hypothetical protein
MRTGTNTLICWGRGQPVEADAGRRCRLPDALDALAAGVVSSVEAAGLGHEPGQPGDDRGQPRVQVRDHQDRPGRRLAAEVRGSGAEAATRTDTALTRGRHDRQRPSIGGQPEPGRKRTRGVRSVGAHRQVIGKGPTQRRGP